MAQFFPSLENIAKLKVKPTEGEWKLLRFLEDLDDTYEVYFQPFINGDNPDVIIMRKSSGVMIIEVKDWDLTNYDVTDKWRLKKNNSLIKSPVEQVNNYKDSLFNLHIQGLLEETIKRNSKNRGIISCAVYFSIVNESDFSPFLQNEANKKYTTLLGSDSLTLDKFKEILKQKWLDRRSKYFTDELYENFKRYLQPPLHTVEQGIEIKLTDKQKALSKSAAKRQKAKGVAGCGKTVILAHRAVNAHKRTGERVLILTYNITLRNYIHDQISKVREEFHWDNFYITNYHYFIENQFTNLGIKKELPEDFDQWDDEDKESYWDENYCSNIEIFREVTHKITKYSAIFIDEIQDYSIAWQQIIQTYFLQSKGELVLFGDEKQNIYGLDLDLEKNSKTEIRGRWNELNQSFRLNTSISNIALSFQESFFREKYEIDEIEPYRQGTVFDINQQYSYLFYGDEKYDLQDIVNQLYEIFKQFKIHPNDICFLSPQIKILREVDQIIRTHIKEKTNTMFETQEMYEHLKKTKPTFAFNSEIDKIRIYKKFHFWLNSGTVKLSTIHSFKGWEVGTLVLIIEDYSHFSDKENEDFSLDELIYTGITRCRDNLIVVNLGNMRYHEFFNKTAREAIS